jgi:hypothetical protein
MTTTGTDQDTLTRLDFEPDLPCGISRGTLPGWVPTRLARIIWPLTLNEPCGKPSTWSAVWICDHTTAGILLCTTHYMQIRDGSTECAECGDHPDLINATPLHGLH